MKIIKPNRVVHSFTQNLEGSPEAVFQMMCPLREADWIVGWDPSLVVSLSGLAEEDCVFTTSAKPADAIWYVTTYDKKARFIEMIKITPGVTACRITISIRPNSQGCQAEITYAHTSLGPSGDEFVRSFTAEFYEKFMQDWESRVNHYLRFGTALGQEGG